MTDPVRSRLRWHAVVLLAVLLAAGAVVGLSYWYLEQSRRPLAASLDSYARAARELAAARQEDQDFRLSAGRYGELIQRGIMSREDRLLLVEWLNGLKARHQLFTLRYNIEPQRPARLAGATQFSSVDPMSTPIQLALEALHEGDALAFIDAVGREVPGFIALTGCTLKRRDTFGPARPGVLQPTVNAACTLEWLTLKERGGAAG
jgi:hypothetical protein